MPCAGPRRLAWARCWRSRARRGRRLTLVRTRITPPSGDGSTPWRTAFSTSGCSSSGGTRARAGAAVELPGHVQAAAEADLLDVEVALRELDLLGRATPTRRASAMATRNSSARSSSTPSARAGSRRTSVSAVLSVLNRKCGRMRDCSSARRAVVSAGSGRLRRAGAATGTMAAAMRRAGERRAEAEQRGEPGARGVDQQGETSVEAAERARPRRSRSRRATARAAAPRQQRASARRRRSSQISTPGRATLEPAAVRREPGRERRRGEDHADRHHAVHEQQRAQDDADVADVERRIRPAPRAARIGAPTSKTVRAEAGRAHGLRPRYGAHRRRKLADRIAARRGSDAWPSIVANRRPAVRPVAPRRRDPCDRPLHARQPSPPDVRQPVRQEVRGLVGAVLRADERAGPALHGERRLRPPPLARRHRRQPRARRDAGRRRASSPPPTSAAIERGLAHDRAPRSSAARFEWKLDLEDVHLNIEARLIAARRRRRQAPAHRPLAQRPGRHRRAPLAARRDRPASARSCAELQRALVELAERSTPRPSCPASPTCRWRSRCRFAHHLLAYVEMFARDAERMAEVRARTNRLPLGAAALAGTSYPLDRETRAPRRSRMDGDLPEQHRRGQRPRLRDRVHAPRRACAMVHISRLSARSWCSG